MIKPPALRLVHVVMAFATIDIPMYIGRFSFRATMVLSFYLLINSMVAIIIIEKSVQGLLAASTSTNLPRLLLLLLLLLPMHLQNPYYH